MCLIGFKNAVVQLILALACALSQPISSSDYSNRLGTLAFKDFLSKLEDLNQPDQSFRRHSK